MFAEIEHSMMDRSYSVHILTWHDRGNGIIGTPDVELMIKSYSCYWNVLIESKHTRISPLKKAQINNNLYCIRF